MFIRFICRLVPILLISCIFMIICLSHLINNVKHNRISLEKKSPPNTLVNLNNFAYIMENKLCLKYDKNFLGIILMTSSVFHRKTRELQRELLSRQKLESLGFKRIFLLSAVPKMAATAAAELNVYVNQRLLEYEQEQYGDLLQGNFEDTYRNLSYKNMMGLRWAAHNCTRAQFIIKVDDDSIFNIFHLKQYLSRLLLENRKLAVSDDYLAGALIEGVKPIRRPNNKWYVAKKDFPFDIYPKYASGLLYITNPLTALRLSRAADAHLNDTFFWFEDVWITGILRTSLNITLQNLNDKYCFEDDKIDCCTYNMEYNIRTCEYFAGYSEGDFKRFVKFMRLVEWCFLHGCKTERICLE